MYVTGVDSGFLLLHNKHMNKQLDTAQPVFIAVAPGDSPRKVVLGQASSWGEATCFMLLGYSIQVCRWDGNKFAPYENYLPGDL